MNAVFRSISVAGLILTLFPSFFVFGGMMTPETHKLLMLVGTVFWFAAAPFWMRPEDKQ